MTRSRAAPSGLRKESAGVRRMKRRRRADGSMSLDFGGGDPAAGEKSSPRLKSVPPASISSRIGASFIDLLILLGINGAVVLLTERLAQISIDAFSELQLLVPLVAFLMLLDFGYVVALTTFGGQTIGKMVIGIKIVLRDDKPAGFRSIVIRTVVAILSIVPCGVGYLYPVIAKSHAMHDVLANTKVVRR